MDTPTNSIFERVQRFERAKAHNLEMCAYIGETLDRDEYAFGAVNPLTEKLWERMKGCGSWLTFRHYLDHDANRLTSANFCGKHLLCQACAIRRGAQKLQAYSERVNYVLSQDKGLTPYLLTFTVKNGEDLRERFKHLQDSFKHLHHRRKRGQNTELSKVAGAVFSYEIPKSKDGETWHPHIHLLALCSAKIDLGWVDPETGEGHGLRKEWFDITGDSFQVDCRRREGQPVIEMAMEVMKYAVKFSAQDPADTWYAFQALNGRRLFGAFGCLWGVKVPKELTESPLTGPFIEYVYRYGSNGYALASVADYSEAYEQPSKIDHVRVDTSGCYNQTGQQAIDKAQELQPDSMYDSRTKTDEEEQNEGGNAEKFGVSFSSRLQNFASGDSPVFSTVASP